MKAIIIAAAISIVSGCASYEPAPHNFGFGRNVSALTPSGNTYLFAETDSSFVCEQEAYGLTLGWEKSGGAKDRTVTCVNSPPPSSMKWSIHIKLPYATEAWHFADQPACLTAQKNISNTAGATIFMECSPFRRLSLNQDAPAHLGYVQVTDNNGSAIAEVGGDKPCDAVLRDQLRESGLTAGCSQSSSASEMHAAAVTQLYTGGDRRILFSNMNACRSLIRIFQNNASLSEDCHPI